MCLINFFVSSFVSHYAFCLLKPLLTHIANCVLNRGGGIRTHSAYGNGFTVRRDSPTSPPLVIFSVCKTVVPEIGFEPMTRYERDAFATWLLWHTGILNWMPFWWQLNSLQHLLLFSLFLYYQNTYKQFYDFYSFSILLICLSSFLTTPGHFRFFGESFKVDNLFFINANLCSLLIFYFLSFPLII